MCRMTLETGGHKSEVINKLEAPLMKNKKLTKSWGAHTFPQFYAPDAYELITGNNFDKFLKVLYIFC